MKYLSIAFLLLAVVLSAQLSAAAPVASQVSLGEPDVESSDHDLMARSPLGKKLAGSKTKGSSSARPQPLPVPQGTAAKPAYVLQPPPAAPKGKSSSSGSSSGSGYALPRPGKAQALPRPPPAAPNPNAWPSKIQEMHPLPPPQ